MGGHTNILGLLGIPVVWVGVWRSHPPDIVSSERKRCCTCLDEYSVNVARTSAPTLQYAFVSLQCSATWQVSIFIDSILICPRHLQVDRGNLPAITHPHWVRCLEGQTVCVVDSIDAVLKGTSFVRYDTILCI